MDAPLPFSTRPLPSPWIAWIAGLGALLIAAASAHPYAGSWNDGSRLAAVESLGDRHTFQIDDSIFCHTPADTLARGCPPYASHNQLCLVYGTRDKLLIDGHFYSDKPPVISLLMAGLYKALRVFGLPPAAQRPDLFCWALTFLTSGLAYVVAVLAMHRLGRLIGLPPRLHVLWLSSFALASVAVVYTRYVNNHILELALVAVIAEQLIGLSARAGQRTPVGRLALLGTLAGLGFNLDLGSGPLLVMVLAAAVVWLCRRFAAVAIFVLTAVPWVAAGVGINYAIGGVWKPMNMVPEYLTWPGSPFTPENMTGFFGHRWLDASVYLLSLLLGRRGLLLHNLPLFLLIPTLAGILRRPMPGRAGLGFLLAWCGETWLLYGVLSNNSGGVCCSIRWFVPFLAPAYWALGLVLREHPRYSRDFLVLSAWGAGLAVIMWWFGPWTYVRNVVLFPIVACALVSWWVARRTEGSGAAVSAIEIRKAQAA